ncbi:hypothetical protein I3842_10G103700 [Carya illinoinensis]|uniref:Protein TIC 100 n=1 Tax=Carya illinoinensis TaxID=32201 RepID=A0A922DXU9_CARIL|nr:hypothetical protein I3842_10G103700 [Carya illinoinensis]
MAGEDSTRPTELEQKDEEEKNPAGEDQVISEEDSDESESYTDDSSYFTDYSDEETLTYVRPGDERPASENTAEANIKRLNRILDSNYLKKQLDEEDREMVNEKDRFDFPKDPENWREEDLKEIWADAPLAMTKPGWDPVWADEDDWDVMREEVKAGRDPPIAPFYLPYRKPYPVIPDNNYDVATPKAAVEELDRIEEFLKWVSYIFEDGSSYEGTVWDDLAHGKGVFVAEQGLVRYEGEWLQNHMEGHGVIEVDIPDIEPVPGSKLEAKMRAEGKIIARDYMTPEDREWLEMDIEDSIRLADGVYEVPFYERDEWIQEFGRKPEKGRYRYAGQWKHGRMHGCGVYDVNERTIYGRFYFGELLADSTGCDEDTCAVHSGIAEVAAAKARMFVNKPDGMVREERGPYSDPQHPYFYEEEDVWMAPGFINQFYKVPYLWERYVSEVDKEREMWLNSFYKAPLRLPMPAELEHWWSKDHFPEFVLINKEPEPDPKDPSKLIYTEDPLILHTPTGRLINYIEDEKYGLRLFWQPPLKDGEDIDPEKVQFLPLGYDEFFGRDVSEKKENIWMRIILALENTFKPWYDKVEKWAEEKKKASEMKMKVIEKELELIEAELCLEEAIEDMDEELKMREKEEEKKVEVDLQDEEDTSALNNQDERSALEQEEEVEEEEEDEDDVDVAPSSFGSVGTDKDLTKNNQKGNKPGKSPFSTSSLSFASSSLISGVPLMLQRSFLAWKKGRTGLRAASPLGVEAPSGLPETVNSVSFPPFLGSRGRLRAVVEDGGKVQVQSHSNVRLSQLHSLSQILSRSSGSVKSKRSLTEARRMSNGWLHKAPVRDFDSILSLHTPEHYLEPYRKTICGEPMSLSL